MHEVSGTTCVAVALFLATFGVGCQDSSPASDQPTTITLDVTRHVADSVALHEVRDVRVGDDSTTWIVNGAAPFIVRADATGAVTRFGNHGEGPAELSYPTALLYTNKNGFAVLDAGRRVRVDFAPNGREVRRAALPVNYSRVVLDLVSRTYGDPFRVYQADEHFVTSLHPWGIENLQGYWSGRIVAYADAAVSDPTTLIDFSDWQPLVMDNLGRARESIPIPLWDLCGTSQIAAYVPFADSLFFVSLDGARLHAEPVLQSPPTLSRAEKDRLARKLVAAVAAAAGLPSDQLDAAMPEFLPKALEEISNYSALYTDMECDEDANVWLRRFSLESGGGGQHWDVVGAAGNAGTFVRVELPSSFQPHRMEGTTWWGVLVDSLDVETVAGIAVGRVRDALQ